MSCFQKFILKPGFVNTFDSNSLSGQTIHLQWALRVETEMKWGKDGKCLNFVLMYKQNEVLGAGKHCKFITIKDQ